MIIEQNEITKYFHKSLKFGSLFILSNADKTSRIVAEIKQINDGQNQLSFIPLSEEETFEFKVGETLDLINEANNISFQGEILAIHNKTWVTIKYPNEIKVVNLRAKERFMLSEKHLSGPSKIISFGEEGMKPLMNNTGSVLDLSEDGASFEIQSSALSGYYKGDIVELMVTEKFPFLTQVKGKVVHKTIGNMMNKEDRVYRIGIKFNKRLNLSPLQLS